jgi:hypothetical protein
MAGDPIETIRRMAVTIAAYRVALAEATTDDYALPEAISEAEQHLCPEDQDWIDAVPAGGYRAVLAWIDDRDMEEGEA